MHTQNLFKQQYPQATYLEQENIPVLHQYLLANDWLAQNESILEVEKPGEGNMNFVIRVKTDRRSLILKQSRPWVQKYPQVAAPVERVYVEYNFYRFIAPHKAISHYTPAVLGFDPDNFVLLLEDLGEGADYTYLYGREHFLSAQETEALVSLLSALHRVRVDIKDRKFFDNQAMKKLNHEHIFLFPFAKDNGLNLNNIQEGLETMAEPYRQDNKLKETIKRLGDIYLNNYDTLLHGDYYPGSWLKVPQGLMLIDPEFSYFGKAEFDLGIMLAHLKMSQHPDETVKQIIELYDQPSGFDDHLMWAFAGVEIMRRLIGLAQLPLALSIQEKADLMQEAASLIDRYTKENF